MTNVLNWLKKNWVLLALVVLILYLGYDKFVQPNDHTAKKEMSTSIYQVTEALAATPAATPAVTPVASTTTVVSNDVIEWCVRLDGSDGAHLPDLLKIGQDNGRGGQNWYSKRDATGAEKYGILPDGTFFVKASLLQEAGMQAYVELKTNDVNSWSPTKMLSGKVNGEDAYLYVTKK